MSKPLLDTVPVQGLDLQVGLLMSVLEDATNEWRGEFEEVSDETVIWQPFPGGHSIGAVLLHIADVEAYWIHQIGGGYTMPDEQKALLMGEQTDQDAVKWPTSPAKPLSWYFEQHDMIRRRTREVVAQINDPVHIGERPSHQFTFRWILNHVISHEAYHGGQAVLLALMYEKGVR
jgi:uncharacterized damage-inducible protein DinB